MEEVGGVSTTLDTSTEEHQKPSLLDLPEEVLHFLLEYLDDKDHCKLASSCHRLAKVCVEREPYNARALVAGGMFVICSFFVLVVFCFQCIDFKL